MYMYMLKSRQHNELTRDCLIVELIQVLLKPNAYKKMSTER